MKLNMLEIEDWKKDKYYLAYNMLEKFNDVFPNDNHLLMKYPGKKIIERAIRKSKISNLLCKGTDTVTMDLGCQFGQMTKLLQNITGGKVYGIELNSNYMTEKDNDNDNVKYIIADIVNWEPPEEIKGKVDQIVCSSLLHEVYSQYGIDGYYAVICKCNELLKNNGRLIIIDAASADEVVAVIKFKDIQTRIQLDMFNTLYKPFKIEFENIDESLIRVDLSKLSRFLISLKFVVPENLEEYELTLLNIKETKHAVARAFYLLDFYTQPIIGFEEEFTQDVAFLPSNKWTESLEKANFTLNYVELWNEREIESCFLKSGIDIITPQIEIPKNHIIIVSVKN